MVRRSLIAAAAILAVGSPLTAQSPTAGQEEEWTWSADRPDARGLLGVFADRTLAMGELELSYHFSQLNYRGVYFGRDSLPLASTLQLFNDAPLTRSDIVHNVRFGFGVTDDLTIVARGGFAVLERETIANNGLVRVGIEQFTDLEVGALYDVIASGPYRMHFQAGAIVPVMPGNTTYADTTAAQTGNNQPLPYDMRTSGGTYAVIAGIGGSVQNEMASLGAQFRMRVNVASNDAGGIGYTLGDRYEANGWGAYNINDNLAILAGVRWENWDNIDGHDIRLNVNGDPHNQGGMLAGQRVMLPAGLNFIIPGESVFAGHQMSLEAVYSMHHDYEGPQLGLDWGLNLGYTVGF